MAGANNPTSKLTMTFLAGMATCERDIMRERQAEGKVKGDARCWRQPDSYCRDLEGGAVKRLPVLGLEAFARRAEGPTMARFEDRPNALGGVEYCKMRVRFRFSIATAFTFAALLVSLNMSAQTKPPAVENKVVAQSDTAVLEHVTDNKEKLIILAAITGSIKRLNSGAKILTCDHVVRYTDSAIPGKDSSFAAVCTFDFGSRYSRLYTAAVCDDLMIGKFTFGGGNGSNLASDQDYKAYIALNCPPGG